MIYVKLFERTARPMPYQINIIHRTCIIFYYYIEKKTIIYNYYYFNGT